MHDTPGGVAHHPGAKGHPRDERASKQSAADQDLGVVSAEHATEVPADLATELS